MAASATLPLRVQADQVPDMRIDHDPCSCAVVLDGPLGQAYNEEGFRYFLDIERKRSEATNRPLLLLLVDLKGEAGTEPRMPAATAARLFAALADCLRETDFVGWYREERVAGAVLTQRADAPRSDVSPEIGERVTRRLSNALPLDEARRLQVRVFQLPPRNEE